MAHFDDDAAPMSQVWTSSGTKLAHFEKCTDGNCFVLPVNHSTTGR
ncbi:hypothetical protein NK6_263 [Bradyrhizobium diazoefficiens]|uniref:Uncharacterized protein n=1 Tax=Bradyrhizobium diazoefficiens TaxID=1355477 RepID=A0A0E4BK17_9BRAD|nr:hypothetical protein NK6_263 [Bradyrhizobium diazoefficiens]